jgi:hypothetical protein
VTIERACSRAETLDSRMQKEIAERALASPSAVFSEIRAYLYRRCAEMRTENNPYNLLKLVPESNGVTSIALGPTFDKGPTNGHFHFESGGRLSFGLTLREHDRGSQLVSFRYHYHFPDGASPKYLRFDLNQASHADPLVEPRCHLHPGRDDVRIPLSLHDPFEILDRIFFVIEESL